MNLKNQRRMAADLMKVGQNRVKFNPERMEEVSEALTREDVRYLISSGAITKKPVKGNSRGRIKARQKQKKKGKQRGQGSRKGSVKTRVGGKRAWITKIRAIRDELRKIREENEIEDGQYRALYLKAKGNLFHSRRHLREYVGRMKK